MQLVTVSKVYGSSIKCAKLIVAQTDMKWDGKTIHEGNKQGNVTVDNVHFSYPTKPNIPILKGVKIEVKTNQVVALVGASGCGKSSIIQLMERFYDPDYSTEDGKHKGKMWFNDDDLKELDNSWYH